MSVAIGTLEPTAPVFPALKTTEIAAGTILRLGGLHRGEANSLTKSSRLISRPTTKTAMNPSSIQWCSGLVSQKTSAPWTSFIAHKSIQALASARTPR